MSLTSSEMTPADFAAVTGRNNNDEWGGNGAWWIIILFLFAFMGNGWGGFGNNGANGAGYTDAAIQRGFDTQSVMNKLNGLENGLCDGFYAMNSTMLTNFNNANIANLQGFNGVQSTISTAAAGLNNTMTQYEMNRQQCCCDTKQAIADVKYTIATEACASRAAVADGIRDILESNTANTQAILDKMCQQEIEAKNETIANLRSQLNISTLVNSQAAQTAQIMANNTAQTRALEQYLAPSPIPAYVVQNPNTSYNYGCCAS